MIGVNLEGPSLQIVAPYFQKIDDGNKLEVKVGVVAFIQLQLPRSINYNLALLFEHTL